MAEAKVARYESLSILAGVLRFFGCASLLLIGAGALLLLYAATKGLGHFVMMLGPALGLIVLGLFQVLLYFSGAALLDAVRDMAVNSHLILAESKLTNQLLDAANSHKEVAPLPDSPSSAQGLARMFEFEVFGKLSDGQHRTYKVLAKNQEEARDTAFTDGLIEIHNIRRLQ